ncbi:hypothetical protein BGW36DRAFT_361987 [Talaromyces proteolyticus]|uniref:Magnesium transporter n=1 Tax=Talaromyces proteolyticus TaxID=1131652 RepID=A0AAD4KLL7_9EURO|nr:uncharacterized protein BGW36DRAFT_361987 [Talaromyces proteolyticus]KAH8694168.1 hypothetical protein BGW36DRAFT_361987 [Talaromyces proteolyticus]
MNGNVSLKYTRYNSNGTAPIAGHTTKLNIADRYGLSTRDLHVFDLPSGGFPHTLVRENTILIHLFDLRLLVQHDHALLFTVTESSSPDPVPGQRDNSHEPQQNTDSGSDNRTVSRVFTHFIEEKTRVEQSNVGWLVNQPYELCVVEAAFAAVTSVLRAEYILTKQQIYNTLKMTTLDKLGGDESLVYTELRLILDLTRKLARIQQRTSQVRDTVQEVLNEDEDMASMYLTDKRAGKPHAAEDHQDVEYLFEAYFKASDSVVQDATSLIDNIRRTEETIQSTLSVRRNQIMILEAKIEIMMLAIAGPTLIAGWYGMNVLNYFEDSGQAFAAIVFTSFAAIVSASWYGMRKLRRIHALRF